MHSIINHLEVGCGQLVVYSFSHSVIQSLINQSAVSNPQLAIFSIIHPHSGQAYSHSFIHSVNYQSSITWKLAVGSWKLVILSFSHTFIHLFNHQFYNEVPTFIRKLRKMVVKPKLPSSRVPNVPLGPIAMELNAQ